MGLVKLAVQNLPIVWSVLSVLAQNVQTVFLCKGSIVRDALQFRQVVQCAHQVHAHLALQVTFWM